MKDGGPAFARPYSQNEYWDSPQEREAQTGMTLRDYFAAAALTGLLANPGGPIQANGMSGWGLTNCTVEGVVGLANEFARDMLAAREAKTDE